MITTDDANTMLIEIVTGKKPTLTTPEADALREKLTQEVAEIRAKGGIVEIPREVQA